ncbi:MAG TPA: DUF2752 domain-containing protein [Verrucomicrobiae bacterium]|jgi:hypothetical protein
MAARSQSVPPKISAPPSLGFFAATTLAFAGIAAVAVLFFFDPSKNNFYPVCAFHKLTGLNCPGCGATRAFYALLHGNFALALKDNALFIFALAALAARGAWFAAKHFLRKPAGQFLPSNFLWTFLVVAVIFTVLRNLPAFAWLSP